MSNENFLSFLKLLFLSFPLLLLPEKDSSKIWLPILFFSFSVYFLSFVMFLCLICFHQYFSFTLYPPHFLLSLFTFKIQKSQFWFLKVILACKVISLKLLITFYFKVLFSFFLSFLPSSFFHHHPTLLSSNTHNRRHLLEGRGHH